MEEGDRSEGLRVSAPEFVEKNVSGVLCTQFNNSNLQMVLSGGEGYEFENLLR